MNPTIIKDTTTQSMAGKMSFPEVVQTLAKEGVESYQVDLVQNLKSFYMPIKSHYACRMQYLYGLH